MKLLVLLCLCLMLGKQATKMHQKSTFGKFSSKHLHPQLNYIHCEPATKCPKIPCPCITCFNVTHLSESQSMTRSFHAMLRCSGSNLFSLQIYHFENCRFLGWVRITQFMIHLCCSTNPQGLTSQIGLGGTHFLPRVNGNGDVNGKFFRAILLAEFPGILIGGSRF